MTKIKANQLEIQEIMDDPLAQATETRKGTLQIATQAEVNGGSPYDNTIVVTPQTLANFDGLANNWIDANNGVDFTTPPSATGTRTIALGDSANGNGSYSIAIGDSSFVNASASNSISIGTNAYCNAAATNAISIGTSQVLAYGGIAIGQSATIASLGTVSIAIGRLSITSQTAQTVIGPYARDTSTTTDVGYSVKLGYGAATTNKNMLHLFSKGKLELVGEEAQFIFPNYRTAGSPLTNPLPSTTTQGGAVYDDTDKVIKFYNGTTWAPLAVDNNWLLANNGSDFGTSPISTGANSIALGNNASTSTITEAIAIGTNATAAVNAVSIGVNSDALSSGSVAVGNTAQAVAGSSVAIGINSSASGLTSVAIGSSASTTGDQSVSLGNDNDAAYGFQTVIGSQCKTASVALDVTHSVKLGYGVSDANKNMLHLFSKGKLELYGEDAQFIFPNYQSGSPGTPIPSTTNEGGAIWDSTTKQLKVYDGTAFSAVGTGMQDVIDDASPQLGGNLDVNGKDIITPSITGGAVDAVPIELRSGANDQAAKTSGDINIIVGAATSSAIGGDVAIQAGNSAFGDSGSISILAGASSVAGNGGNITIAAGQGAGLGGNCYVGAGSAFFAATTGGKTRVYGGAGFSGPGGNVEIVGGSASSGNIGGNVELIPGSDGVSASGYINVHYGDGLAGQASIRFWDDTQGKSVALKAPAFVGSPLTNITFTLPQVDGNGGDVMQTDGSGILTFADLKHLSINTQIGLTYTLVLTDDGKLVTMNNGSTNTLTIPTNASVAFPIGTQILVEQEGTGTTTISGAGSPPTVTIHSAGAVFDTASQYTTISLIKKATDTWLIVGDLV